MDYSDPRKQPLTAERAMQCLNRELDDLTRSLDESVTLWNMQDLPRVLPLDAELNYNSVQVGERSLVNINSDENTRPSPPSVRVVRPAAAASTVDLPATRNDSPNEQPPENVVSPPFRMHSPPLVPPARPGATHRNGDQILHNAPSNIAASPGTTAVVDTRYNMQTESPNELATTDFWQQTIGNMQNAMFHQERRIAELEWENQLLRDRSQELQNRLSPPAPRQYHLAEKTPLNNERRYVDESRLQLEGTPGKRVVNELSKVIELDSRHRAPLSVFIDKHWEDISKMSSMQVGNSLQVGNSPAVRDLQY